MSRAAAGRNKFKSPSSAVLPTIKHKRLAKLPSWQWHLSVFFFPRQYFLRLQVFNLTPTDKPEARATVSHLTVGLRQPPA
eukprot:752238-Hanusia_phi.AAC.1